MPHKDTEKRLQYARDYWKELTQQRKADGLCVDCGKVPPREGRTQCQPCADENIQKGVERWRVLIKTLKQKAVEYLGGKCIDCGLETHIVAVYDFPHVQADVKEAGIANLIRKAHQWERVRKELDKCILLCANSHRIRHALEQDAPHRGSMPKGGRRCFLPQPLRLEGLHTALLMNRVRTPNKRLQHARELNGWSQQDVAKHIGTSEKIVSRWECGESNPLPYYRKKLCALFGKNAEELGFLAPQEIADPAISSTPDSAPSTQQKPEAHSLAPFFWNIPHQRNPFFTGREPLLWHLYDLLKTGHAIALAHVQAPPHAISGLGGIGKTQTALEYAYRYHHEYKAVLWVKADTRENLLADFTAIAVLLNLVEKDEREPDLAVDAVRRWLKDHTDWLLILDNADDLALLRDFLPTLGRGHTLITTRASAVGRMAKRIEIDNMESDEGTLFLLRRIGILGPEASLHDAPNADRECARKIVRTMEGLPLALDQAGAYIEETGISISDYLDLYQAHRAELLKRRSVLSSDYPHTVATVWSLSFQKVELADPAAAELLHLCAFLDPDAIPEELIIEGAPALGPLLGPINSDQLRLNEAIEVLLHFSLIRRNAQRRTLTTHRMVQAVIQDNMPTDAQRKWAERAIRAVHYAFPNYVEAATWQRCQRCLPHAQACAALMDQYGLAFAEGAHLFNQAGYYLKERALHAEAEAFYRRALAIREQVLGPEHLDTAQSLYNSARLYYEQGKYADGEQLYLRVLAIREQVLGPEHPDTAHCLNNLALLYVSQGKYVEAEQLHLQVLAIRQKVLPPDHPDTAQTLQNLAGLYYVQGDQSKYAEAERLYQRSLAIREQVLGPEHLQTAKSLHNLALLYETQGKYREAEPLYQRALAIRGKVLGPENPKTISTLENYAALLRKWHRVQDAVLLEARMQAIQDQRV
jgi:tetratricopeptide (TPR) repeat protein/transcriptional regulator with XRE-family HTH domain